MATLIYPEQFRNLLTGIKVDRAAKVLPAGATESIFTVTGGAVLITGLVGTVTTATDATATNLSVVATPTSGTAVTLASTVAAASKEVGAMFALNATAGGALVSTTAGAAYLVLGYRPIVAVGNIQIITSATNAGVLKWSLTYVPWDTAGRVAAA